MCSHLTKREKQKKLVQARKRAVIWSTQQQTCIALRKSSSSTQSKSTVTGINPRNSQKDNFLHPLDTLSFVTPIILKEDQTKTTNATQQTLKDLQDQQQAINITNDVLSQRLNFLLNTKSPR